MVSKYIGRTSLGSSELILTWRDAQSRNDDVMMLSLIVTWCYQLASCDTARVHFTVESEESCCKSVCSVNGQHGDLAGVGGGEPHHLPPPAPHLLPPHLLWSLAKPTPQENPPEQGCQEKGPRLGGEGVEGASSSYQRGSWLPAQWWQVHKTSLRFFLGFFNFGEAHEAAELKLFEKVKTLMTQVHGNEKTFAQRCFKRKLQSSAHDIRGSRRLSTLCDFMEVSSLRRASLYWITFYVCPASKANKLQARNLEPVQAKVPELPFCLR